MSDRPAFASQADSLMAAFERAWERRDFVAYDDLLAEDFVFGFRPLPPHEDTPPTEVLERALEVDVADRLFGRRPGRLPDGTSLAPIQTIELWLTPRNEWARSREPGHAGTVSRLYLAELMLETETGQRVQVRSIQEFFVREGASARAARLQGWNEPSAWQVGRTYIAGTTWGDVKRAYGSARASSSP